jgi:phosphohistidine phosphatase
MEIYLVRHGKAEPGPGDAARALTSDGRGAIGLVAARLGAMGVRVDRIDHSPLRRAVETAEILGRELGGPLSEAPDLLPGSDVLSVRRRLGAEDPGAIMLVGHNPFMEDLAALLLAEEPDRRILTLQTGAVAHLRPLAWRYSCDWLLTPDAAG